MSDFVLSAATFAALLLLFGAWQVKKRANNTRQMWLMIIAAMVIFINIAIWITPNRNGQSLANPAAIDPRK